MSEYNSCENILIIQASISRAIWIITFVEKFNIHDVKCRFEI